MRNFFLGLVVGSGLMFGALTYHLVRADDGFHLVPKLEGGFGESYVDIREFTVRDWMDHRSLAAAIIRDDKESLMSDTTEESFRSRVRDALRGVVGEE